MDDLRSANYVARESWWRWEELNLRHGAYETPALPLSYTADGETAYPEKRVYRRRTVRARNRVFETRTWAVKSA